ncbi:MAG TPA: hypothetical protein PK743_08715 [Luteimonas sp.]|nr:hypothetical protein [Luteimonas sp.]HRO27536.1 hypothetical protein [Luteimonas sp.]HRP72699.1 hypothetical protein [Luteimonas sp.]
MDRKFDGQHRWALTATISVHVLVAAWWWTAPELRDAAVADEALQVVWIERPAPSPPASVPHVPEPNPTAPGVAKQRPVPPAAPRPALAQRESLAAPSSDEPRPLSAVFLEQASALARAEAGHDFRRNPLTDRPVLIAAPPPERIRMREALTAAQVVAGIGQLFGGPGYSTDPCPQIRRNLGNLRTAGADNELLQEEIRRHQQFCQG